MKDLANERAEVCSKLEEFNFEPVNAEGLLPNGTGSWQRLEPEIESCDVFVLILGESYGWIPTTGPRASEGKSVTELEYDAAQRVGLPVLAFQKRLVGGNAPSDEDAKLREAFRARVNDWAGGVFRGEFELARDLAKNVGHAVVGVVTEDFLRVRTRKERTPAPNAAASSCAEYRDRTTVELPRQLVLDVSSQQTVLFLGAGASLQAGLPSAAAFVDAMVERIRSVDDEYTPASSGTLFNAVATDYVSLLGTTELHTLAKRLLIPAFAAEPTIAHRISVRLFDAVLTTNFDTLLEQACESEDLSPPPRQTNGGRIVKLHGSIDAPETLILTENNIADLEKNQPQLWADALDLLTTRTLLSVGTSLRDPSIVRLLQACQPNLRGWVVLPEFSKADEIRLAKWGLTAIRGDADNVLEALAVAVGQVERA